MRMLLCLADDFLPVQSDRKASAAKATQHHEGSCKTACQRRLAIVSADLALQLAVSVRGFQHSCHVNTSRHD